MLTPDDPIDAPASSAHDPQWRYGDREVEIWMTKA
jgi:hypothetical protein